MAAENEIQLKIIIDGKDAVATLKLTEEEIKKLSSHLTPTENNLKKTTAAVSTLGNVSKRDLGMFANQLLYTSGVTGKLGGQLSNLATGLLTGGAIGAAFAGLSAIINGLVSEAENFNRALETIRSTATDLPAKLKAFNDELNNLRDPGFWESLRFATIQYFGGLGAAIEDNTKRVVELNKALQDALGPHGTIGYLAGLQAQLDALEKERVNAPTKERALSYNAEIFRLQKEINSITGSPKVIDALKEQLKFEKALLEIRRASRKLQARGLDIDKIDLNNPDFAPTGIVSVPNKPTTIISESIAELQLQLDLINSIDSAWQSAGYAAASALTSQIRLFGQVNSVAEVFLQTLIEIALQQAALALFNFLTGNLFGGSMPFGAMAEGGSGIVTKPTLFLAGEAGPEAYNFSPLDRPMNHPQTVNVHLTGEFTQKGMDMRAVLNQVEETLRRNQL